MIRSANEELDKLVGPKLFYDRWLRWRSQSEVEAKRQAIAEELTKFLNAEPVSECICRVCCPTFVDPLPTVTFLIGKGLPNDVVFPIYRVTHQYPNAPIFGHLYLLNRRSSGLHFYTCIYQHAVSWRASTYR